MEYADECYCGNAIIAGGKLAAADTDCSMNCAGNAAEKCGAGNRMSVYNTGTLSTVAPPKTQMTGIPGSWTYQGCLS